MRSLVSPVFFSTMEDGTVVQGLGALPVDRWVQAACCQGKAVEVMPSWVRLHSHRQGALGARVPQNLTWLAMLHFRRLHACAAHV